MIVAVASGKGGTGKTTVATSLAVALDDRPVTYLDCDVEAPNAHIFLHPELSRSQVVTLPVPEVNASLCDACGVCAEVCQYHAIVVVGGRVLVFPQLCHGCGSCSWNCPRDAILEKPSRLGVLEGGRGVGGLRFGRGVLNIGEPMAVPVIRELKRWMPEREGEWVIRDAPPGTSCPVVETLRGAGFVLLVTEPTPFGLHDLWLAAQVVSELGLPAGVVVNRVGVGDRGVEEFCRENRLPILMRIPLERRIGEAVARGRTLVQAFPEYEEEFRGLMRGIVREASALTATDCEGALERPGAAVGFEGQG